MSKRATGEVRRDASGRLSTRIRFAGDREPFDLPTCQTDEEALERSTLLSNVARQLARCDREQALEALKIIAEAAPRSLKNAIRNAEELAGAGAFETGKSAPTFRQVGEMWTKGELHKRFPDHVESVEKDYWDVAAKRLEKGVYPVLADLRIDRVARDDCDEAMRKLPAGLSRSTRRHYAGLINRVLNLAELAGYIDRNPLPRGWLPKPGPQKRFPILYPAEDKALLGCVQVPLAYRMLYGFLHREGMRRGEAAALQWCDVDLENETVSLDENKTDHARWWKLTPGVALMLAAWAEYRGGVEPTDRVFTDEHGRPLRLDHLADVVRAHLKKAGIKRPDLTSEGANKGQFGLHCFRRSFVTRSLALGKNEDWVRQRTGHKSEQLLRYRQTAKALAELHLSELDPLPVVLSGLPPDCPTDTSRRWRNWQTRWIQVPVG